MVAPDIEGGQDWDEKWESDDDDWGGEPTKSVSPGSLPEVAASPVAPVTRKNANAPQESKRPEPEKPTEEPEPEPEPEPDFFAGMGMAPRVTAVKKKFVGDRKPVRPLAKQVAPVRTKSVLDDLLATEDDEIGDVGWGDDSELDLGKIRRERNTNKKTAIAVVDDLDEDDDLDF